MILYPASIAAVTMTAALVVNALACNALGAIRGWAS